MPIPDEERKLIEDTWEWFIVQQNSEGKWHLTMPAYVTMLIGTYDTEEEAYAVAVDTTRARKLRIQDVSDEIDFLNEEREAIDLGEYMDALPIIDRIIDREQRALAELKKGMRHAPTS
jgi:hypothetical protein